MNNFESTCRSESNASGVYSTKPARTKMMKLFLPLQASALVLSFWTLGSQAFVELPNGTSCNGLPEYCNLAVNQFTFSGTHNSGAGFSGSLRRCNGQPQNDCIWRSQGLNISGQLELGIRLLNIDTCFLCYDCDDTVYGSLGDSRLFACYGDEMDMSLFGYRYGGPVLDVFEQVNNWMIENPNEVVVLHFTEDTPSENMSSILPELARLLERMWSTTSNELALNTYFSENGEWPTLQQAIVSNQRIIVLVDEGLRNVNSSSRPWINPPPRSTFVPGSWSGNACPGLLDSALRCNTSEEFVLATGFTLGQCIPEGQMDCNPRLLNATYACYDLRLQFNQTVNALLVDFPEQAGDNNSVFQVTKAINAENLERYLGINVFPVDTTTSVSTDAANVTQDVTTEASKGEKPLKYTLLVYVVVVMFAIVNVFP